MIPNPRARGGARASWAATADEADDGDAYRADRKLIGRALPSSLDAALEALDGDKVLQRTLGPQTVETFLAVKRVEIERHRAWVSDWEIAEYLHHL